MVCIVLLFESEHDLQGHLNALDDFYTQRGLEENLRKTKFLIFLTFTYVKNKYNLTLSNRQVAVVESHIYRGVTFSFLVAFMAQVGNGRLIRAYMFLSLLERQCHKVYFQDR